MIACVRNFSSRVIHTRGYYFLLQTEVRTLDKNSRGLRLKNEAASTPAQLISSVLEQRYAHKSSPVIKNGNERPDPMTFPAMQQALGSVYSAIVEIVGEENEVAQENAEAAEAEVETGENVQKLGRQLMDMVDEIEQNDKKRDEENNAEVVEVRKNDPYNRALNSYSEAKSEIATIDISEDMAIETIVSDSRKKSGKRFRIEGNL